MVGDIQQRFRKLLIQICDSEDIIILKGVVSKDYIHMHIEYRPLQDIISIVKKLKGRTSRKIQQDFPQLRINTGADIFGQSVLDVGALLPLIPYYRTNCI